jgi:hypothetical protein
MAAKKKVAKKKAKKKKVKKKGARDAFDANLKSVQDQLPPALARRVRDLRKSMRDLEKGIDKARADREKRWHQLETSIRKDAAQVLRRLEHAIEPPKPKRKKKAAAKK